MQEGPPSLAGWPSPFDHVIGNARLRDLKPKLEQFTVDAWRTPKLVLRAHLPDQRAQLRVDLRSPSLWARLPTPVAAKAGPMPPHQRLSLDNCNDLQDRWKPSIHLDEEPAVVAGRLSSTPYPTPPDDQLMSEHRILSLQQQLRLEWQSQDGQSETEHPDHSASLDVMSVPRARLGGHARGRSPIGFR